MAIRSVLVLAGALLLSSPVPTTEQTGPPDSVAFMGTWASGIAQNRGVQWLVVEFTPGKFTRRFYYQDSEGMHATEDVVRGIWAIVPNALGGNVICSRNDKRQITVCNSYTWTDKDHFAFGEIPFHRVTKEELKLLPTSTDRPYTPGASET
jgi:hypothetical protein